MSQPIITVVGHVATKPRLTTTRQGKPMTIFRVAYTHRRRNRNTGFWEDGDTSWYRVIVWREWSENVAKSLRPGDPVVVTGRLTVKDWTRDGKSGTDAEISAITVGHDLRRGESTFVRIKLERPEVTDEDDTLEEAYRQDDEAFAAAVAHGGGDGSTLPAAGDSGGPIDPHAVTSVDDGVAMDGKAA
jgi:single-strand DNA-binding protein